MLRRLKEVTPELAGRVGRERWRQYQSAKQKLEDAPHLVKDKAAEQLRVAQQKLNRNKSTVAKHMRKFKRNIGGEWHQKFKKAAETPRFGETTKDKLKIAGGVAGAAAGAYGAYRLHKWWKKRNAKAAAPVAAKRKEVKPMKKHQDPTQYPFESSTEVVFGNLVEGGIKAFLRDKVANPLADKYVGPKIHASVKVPGYDAEPHNAHEQKRTTKIYRKLGGKGMIGPTLMRHKANKGAIRTVNPAPGTPSGTHQIIHLPTKGAKLEGMTRKGIQPIKGARQSSALTHEVAHAVLTDNKDISHTRHTKLIPAITDKYHTKNAFGGISKIHPKGYNIQARVTTRAEGKANMLAAGNSKGRMSFAKKSMSGTARAQYNDLKKFAPDKAKAYLQRYKNFRREWRKGNKMAHLKLSSTDHVFCSLCEADPALLAAAARMKKRIAADKKRRRLEELMSSLSKKVQQYPGGNAGAGRLYQLSKTAGKLRQSSTDAVYGNMMEVSQELALRAAGKASRNILDPKRGRQYSRFVRHAMKKGKQAREKAYLAQRTPFSFKGAELFGGGGRVF